MSCDVLIIGGGPAGLSAAINARARGKRVEVVSNPLEENPLWRSPLVDNYPGLPGLSGAELLTALQKHAEASGAEFIPGRVLTTAMAGESWYVSVGSDVRESRSLVLAAGAARGKKFPGEDEFLGRGVSYCATCDGMLYRGKPVAVLGWTESARQEAEYLRSIGCAVTYLEKPRTCAVTGGASATHLSCDGAELDVACIFVLRPAMAPADLFPGLAVENGWVAVDRQMATSLPGLFAAGDCTGGPLQAAKAVGEGLIAGQSAAKWVDAHPAED